MIAIWMSRELTAPPTLMSRIQGDLESLRALPEAEQTALSSAHFSTRWVFSSVELETDSATYYAIERGEYHAWDSLNEVFQFSYYDSQSYDFGDAVLYFVTVRFTRLLHSARLADIYRTLPGVLGAWHQYWYSTGEHSLNDLYPRQRGDTVTYLFHMEWNCGGICRSHRYWYAAALPDTAWIVGDWNAELDANPPEWWSDALTNVEWWWDHE
jgi:hypothetical protein